MVVIALEFFGVVSTERFTLKLIKVWVPVNLIFVGMLVTGMYRYGKFLKSLLKLTNRGGRWVWKRQWVEP